MAERFEEGQNVIVSGLNGPPNGERGTIEGTPQARIARDAAGKLSYVDARYVRIMGSGESWLIAEQYLELYRGEIDTIVSWQDCAWMPAESRA